MNTPQQEDLLIMLKEEVAKDFGYTEAVMCGSRWEYAMLLSHRTKRERQMYDALCNKLLHLI